MTDFKGEKLNINNFLKANFSILGIDEKYVKKAVFRCFLGIRN